MGLAICDPPRTRETDLFEPTTITGHWANDVGGSGDLITISSSTVGSSKMIKDYPHPGFRDRLSRGDLVMGDLILERYTREATMSTHNTGVVPFTGGYWSTSVGDFIGLVERVVPAPSTFIDQDLDRMSQIALAKAYAKINEAPVLSGEILGELDDTIGMLKRPAAGARKLLGKIYRAKKRKLAKTAYNAARATSEAWLEYRYGWYPLILDCQGIIDEAHKLRRRMMAQHLVSRATERQIASATSTFVLQPSPDNRPWYFDGAVRRETVVTASAGVIYDLESLNTIEQLQRSLGYRPSDLSATLWERTPWSFVVDWFANVGTWITAVTPNPWIKVRGNWVTTIERQDVTYTGHKMTEFHDIGNHPRYTSCSPLGSSKRTFESVRRDCNLSLTSHPVLTGKPLSVLRQADAAALSFKPVIDLLRGLRH